MKLISLARHKHISKPFRLKHGQEESGSGVLEVAPGVFLLSQSKKMPGPFFAYTYFPMRPVLGLQGQGHAHLRIVGHVLNRRASPLRGRDPTILKQRTWIKEMRGTLG